MNVKDLKGNLFLLVATIIWGCTFVAQDIAAKIISPFEFQSVRTLIGAVVLVPVILFMDGAKKKSGSYIKPTKKENKDLLLGGIVCGIILCIENVSYRLWIRTEFYNRVQPCGWL